MTAQCHLAAALVGRTPRSGCPLGQVPLDPLPEQRRRHLAGYEQADGGVVRGPGGPPHHEALGVKLA